jgi:putative spermidine/putrescine transport system permease protein
VHIILCGPFAYRPIAVALQKIDGSMPEAAMSLGAREGAVFRRVILPLMKPGIVTALLFTFIISFDEVTVTLFLVSPDVTTLPVMIWGHIRDSADPVVAAISTLLILMTAIIVLAVERLVGLQMFVNPEVEDPNRVRR